MSLRSSRLRQIRLASIKSRPIIRRNSPLPEMLTTRKRNPRRYNRTMRIYDVIQVYASRRRSTTRYSWRTGWLRKLALRNDVQDDRKLSSKAHTGRYIYCWMGNLRWILSSRYTFTLLRKIRTPTAPIYTRKLLVELTGKNGYRQYKMNTTI